MTIPPLEVAVLDMAGTTVEENGTVERSVGLAMRSVGLPADPAGLRRHRGLPKSRMFQLLVDDDDRAQCAYRAFTDAIVDAVRAGAMSAKPGAADVFARLRGAGVRIALITGFAPDVRDPIIDALGWADAVDLVLSPEDVGRGRPYPDLIWAAAARLGATGVRSLLVAGDTRSDLVAAERSGAAVRIGVLGGAHSEAELREAPHTALVHGIAELPVAAGFG